MIIKYYFLISLVILVIYTVLLVVAALLEKDSIKEPFKKENLAAFIYGILILTILWPIGLPALIRELKEGK